MNDNSNILELSHIIGLNHSIPNCVQAHPVLNETIGYCVGGNFITEDLNNKSKQVIFRHETNQISAFKISHSGKYLAVGFVSSNLDKKFPAQITFWDYENKKILHIFQGIFKGVRSIDFSPDDKFISALGLDNSFFIWDTETGNRAYNRVFEFNTNLIRWVRLFYYKDSKYPNYSIIVSNINNLYHYEFVFELKSMQYNMNYNKFSVPSSGLSRIYTSAVYDYKNKILLTGTSGGEICFFNMENHIYKLSFNCINNGITNILIRDETNIIISGGDGKIKQINYSKDSYSSLFEINLPGVVNSLSLTADKSEVIVSCPCQIYRINLHNMNYSLHTETPSMSVNQCCFGGNNETLYSVDNGGNVIQWDLNDFIVKNKIVEKERVTSIFLGEDSTLFVGLANGILKNYDYTLSNLLWEIPAHRGKVNTLFINVNYILTGGEDGVVRVWGRNNHELIMQFPAHHKEVRVVLADNENANIIYSGGEDRNMNFFDLKLQKRTCVHYLKNGFIFGLDQKRSGDREILTVGYNSGLSIWDFFKVEPLGEFSLDKNFFCLKISNSGKYFAIGSEEGEIWLFDLNDFRLIERKAGHSSRVLSIQWSYDDKQFISTSFDGSICIWNFYLN